MKILAITGGSGSGKSTVLNGLKDHFGGRMSMLSLDDYYRPKAELPVDENGETNFDVLQAIDDQKLHADILKLSSGSSVSFDSYTYNKSLMKSEVVLVEPREWLVVEGLFALSYPNIVACTDVKAFIHASPDIRLARRKHRDMTIRGYSPEEVDYQWQHHVRPADKAHIEPHKEMCHVVIENDDDWRPGLGRLIEHMETFDASSPKPQP